MDIRSFNEKDFPAIMDIYAKSKMDELVNESRTFKFLPLDKDLKRLIEFQESDVYVFEHNGIIGYGALFGCEIRGLFVHPDGRGKGFGKLLLAHLLSKIEEPAFLYVAQTNTAAKVLYEKFGFKVVEEFETTYNRVPVLANKMMRARSHEK